MRKFTTTDTALAAYLVVSGVKLTEFNTERTPASYTFEADGQLRELITQWQTETTLLKRFYNVYRSFIRQIKEAQ